ncbi:hypothetical protein GCM10010921_07310 [Microbacterium album]|uniref:Uncharacterized protein n=1 Tax=Microbacterium album TaxID=2053191 RepID=A0A917MKQ0_9MICO|nr:hypothetical protein GCM10010921_07310 [Microbacterium album]
MLNGIALALTAYFAIRGLVRPEGIRELALDIAAVAIYLVVTVLALYVEPPGGQRERGGSAAPMRAVVLAMIGAALIPPLVTLSTVPAHRADSHATWYLGAVGAVMAILCARRRPVSAWIGIGVLAVESIWMLGAQAALSLGLVGSAVWVALAQLLRIFTDRAYRDTARLAALQQATSAWQASQSVRRQERRQRVQYALEVAGPVLSRVIASGGHLSEEERVAARLAEGRLRDELRGARLLDDDVREAITAARRRGAAVTVFDEGGLEGLSPEALARIRRELAETLREADAARIIIRSAPDPDVALTIVGRSAAGEGLTDEDDVLLWREIARRPPGALA